MYRSTVSLKWRCQLSKSRTRAGRASILRPRHFERSMRFGSGGPIVNRYISASWCYIFAEIGFVLRVCEPWIIYGTRFSGCDGV
jgi:hypothetical protein